MIKNLENDLFFFVALILHWYWLLQFWDSDNLILILILLLIDTDFKNFEKKFKIVLSFTLNLVLYKNVTADNRQATYKFWTKQKISMQTEKISLKIFGKKTQTFYSASLLSYILRNPKIFIKVFCFQLYKPKKFKVFMFFKNLKYLTCFSIYIYIYYICVFLCDFFSLFLYFTKIQKGLLIYLLFALYFKKFKRSFIIIKNLFIMTNIF